MHTTAYKHTILFSSTKQNSYYYNIQTDLKKNKETGSCIALAVGGRIKLGLSCRPRAESLLVLLCDHFKLPKAKTWNFSKAENHGRWHVQPLLFVPVKCALALMNWHYYIPLPHLSLLPLYSPTLFHAPSHTFLSLPALWALLMKGTNRPTSQRHIRLYHKKWPWTNFSF